MPVAQSSTLKPLGTLSLSIGMSLAAVSVFLPAFGASGESLNLSLMPCFQAGGGAAGACASAEAENASVHAAAMAAILVLVFIETSL